MTKYRIAVYKNGDGKKFYRPQYRCYWFFWANMYQSNNFHRPTIKEFETELEAELAIHRCMTHDQLIMSKISEAKRVRVR